MVQNILVVQDLTICLTCAHDLFNFLPSTSKILEIYGLTGFSYVLKRHVRIDQNNVTVISNVVLFTYVAT